MRRKATIRRTADGWQVTRPAIGFVATTITTYATWEQARDSLRCRIASAAAQVTQARNVNYSSLSYLRTTNYPLEIQ